MFQTEFNAFKHVTFIKTCQSCKVKTKLLMVVIDEEIGFNTLAVMIIKLRQSMLRQRKSEKDGKIIHSFL